jgi:phage head maturation protease
MPTEEEYRAHGAAPFGHLRAMPFEPTAVDETAHAVEGYISTDQWARDGQRILPQAWAARLDTYRANPIVTWCHSWWDIPIGLAADLRIDDRGLRARLEFDVEDEMGRRVWQAIKTRRLRTTSVSWDGEMAGGSWEARIGDENEYGAWVQGPEGRPGWEWRANITLMETAVVPIPADTDAVFALARSLGLVTPAIGEKRDREDARVLDDLRRLSGAAEAIRNWTRHTAKDGGAPSPAVIEQALSPISDLVEIAAGRRGEARALSAANRALVDEAVEALRRLAGGGEEAGRAFTAATPAGKGAGAPGGDHGQTLDGLLANIEQERAEAALRAVGMRP